ncbi:forkhead box transcription factor [Phanerochaete sordida]|uniref:Forkhead box transcription factor n=1 Tax=Phanerochaete sordida TaxID=48140 RepID=A0A9P3LCK6_9APHY|nr:forkhead box transcription factor [Phanerochaete sordida]
MASLNSLLNPESSQERDMRLQQHAQQQSSSSPSPPPPNTMAYERAAAESNYYAQTDIVMRPHEPHPDCPDTLACLPDTNGRPQHTLPVILRCAILGSPKKRLTIREIYAAMEKKYPYYKTAGPAWKQSVRHHLSLNRLFERQQRPATDPGFGSYWTVNLDAPPGTKRPRKRGRTQKEIIIQTNPGPMIERPYIPMMPIRMEHHQPAPAPTPLMPSPPPQRVVPPPLPPPPRRQDSSHSAHSAHGAHPAHPPPPPQVASSSSTRLRPVDAHSFQTSAVRSSPYDDDDDDEMDWGPGGPQTISDEDYSEDEPMVHASAYSHYQAPLSAASSSSASTSYHHSAAHSPVGHSHSSHSHASHSGHTMHPSHTPYSSHSSHPNHTPAHAPHPPARPGLQGAFSSSYDTPHIAPPQDPAVARLRQEIDAMKRHSSDQEALTIRLSNSLTRAETDAARAKQALKMAESRLEDESRRRVEAERAADEEARLRRMAEERLRSYQTRYGLAAL